MPILHGQPLTRAALLRRVGRLDQVAGVRLRGCCACTGQGVRVLEFRTGGGLVFDVLVDRAFDIGHWEVDGVAVCWWGMASPGIVGPWHVRGRRSWGWFRGRGAGACSTTCGLDHTLSPGEDAAGQFDQPRLRAGTTRALRACTGRVGRPARAARLATARPGEGDECLLWAEGEVLSRPWGLRRGPALAPTHRGSRVGEAFRGASLDRVENLGHTPVSHMQLYHCNAGFPLVDEGSPGPAHPRHVPRRPTTGCPSRATEAIGPPAGPRHGAACFEHDLLAEAGGTVPGRHRQPAPGASGFSRSSRAGRAATLPDRLGGCSRRACTPVALGAQHEPRRGPLGCAPAG